MSSTQSADELVISESEAEIVSAETQVVLEATTDPARRADLEALLEAIADGHVRSDDAARLERVLELSLQAGRIRAIYGPGGEQTALRLYRKLPRGREAVESAREVSDALSTLTGSLERASIEVVGPAAFTIDLTVDGRRLLVRLDRQGARLVSVQA